MNHHHQLEEPILVTGALGFIGKRLVNRLLDENYQVIAMDLPNQKIPDNWREKVRYIEGDISNAQDVEKAVAPSKTIFHLAALVGDWGREELHHKVTVEGTRQLFNAALKYQCRTILASSIVVYGDNIDKGVCHENLAPGKTFGPYSFSKQAQERLAKAFAQQGLALTTVRPANVYGAGSKPWVDDLSTALRAGSPALIGGGQMNAGLVHVNNVVELLMLATAPSAIGQTYNICDEEAVTWKDYMTEIAQVTHAPKPRSIPKFIATVAATVLETTWSLTNRQTRPPITHEALNLICSHHQISINKAKNELGYKPVTKYKEGIKEVKHYLMQSNR